MNTLVPALMASALVLAPAFASAAAPQGPQLASVSPHQIPAGASLQTKEFEIDGSGLVPPGSTHQTVPADVLVFADDGTGWRQGTVLIPGSHGWGVGHLSIRMPPVVPKPPSLRIKVRVRGVDSNVLAVTVFQPPPPAAPAITSVSPSETAIGSTDYYFILKVHTNGQDGTLYFNGRQVTQYVGGLQGPTDRLFQFSVPKEVRNTPGRYPIQVRNSYGDSPLAFWSLVAKPEFVAITPKSLPPAAVAAGAKPVSVTVQFGPSPPKTLWYSADGVGPWKRAEPVTFAPSSATFTLDAAALHPRVRVAIKMVNAAGEAISMLPLETRSKMKLPTPKERK